MNEGLFALYLVTAMTVLAFGALKLIFIPLSLWFEFRRGLLFAPHQSLRSPPPTLKRLNDSALRLRERKLTKAQRHFGHAADFRVSVIVPAYNEEVVLRNCVESILRTDADLLEVILVDDGSTDGTADLMRDLEREFLNVRVIIQENSGKGAALNRGLAQAQGDVLVFVDADGIFSRVTIPWLLTGFRDPQVGAVCGDDRPVNLDRVLTRMLSVLSHLGTGLVRRALSVLRCLPVVSGNIGAFRADLVRELGGFRTDTIGEDLELTWRIYDAGYRVAFEPRAIVLAESPSTLRSLWKQRVRWARGLLQTTKIHWTMHGNPRLGTFGAFLIFNLVTMIIVPITQICILLSLFYLVPAGAVSVTTEQDKHEWFGVLAIVGWIGLGTTLASVLTGIALNRAWRDLRNLWTLPLWPIYSTGIGLTMVAALAAELRGKPAKWNKLKRTGVVSRREFASILGND